MEHHRCFNIPSVDAEFQFIIAEHTIGRAQPITAGHNHQRAKTNAQVARHHIGDLGLTTMRIEQDDPAETRTQNAFRHFGPQGDQRCCPHRQRAGKGRVFVAFPNRELRQAIDRQILGHEGGCCGNDPGVEIAVHRHRQVRPVLFNRGH